jgi:hypothetical protein
MINIYTVKWGTKYSSEYVNKIFRDCVKYLGIPGENTFTFYCITDDDTGLNKQINPLFIPEDNFYEKWWNKMFLFDKNFLKQRGEKLFFDLDIGIQHGLKYLVDYKCEDKLVCVKTHWHDLERMKEDTQHIPEKYTEMNSSILRWNDSLDMSEVWNFMRDYPSQVFWYYRGLDNFFWNRLSHDKIGFFPKTWVYSYNYGYIHPVDVDEFQHRETPFICLYDSMERPQDVKPEFYE